MFVNLFFLILNLLLFTSGIDQPGSLVFKNEPGTACGASLILYTVFLLLIYAERNCSWIRNRLLLICNIELLLFFFCSYFVIGAQRFLFLLAAPFGQTVVLVSSLSMYFGALFVCHYAQVNSTKKSLSAVRFLIPLVVPFVCFIFLSELEGLIPLDGTQQIIVLTTMNIAAIVATFIFFPTLLMLLWGCPKLENSPCTHELGELCHRANFKYSSFRLWEVMDGAATAAIVGIFGRFRYILFSRDLFSRFPPQAIKAVLAHEIGHSYHRHLLIYPFIFSGMIVLGYDAVISLYNPLFGQTGMLVHFFAFSSDLSWVIVQFVVFSILILAIALYFRFVFGYFSRLFERQADLHVFAVGIEAEDMIKALDLLGAISGNTHDEPNWHHYSIRERILFLQEVINNPTLIEKHHRHVRYSLIGYSCILMLFFAYFIVNIEVFL